MIERGESMVYRGRVHNGVVVLEGDVQLPDGMFVTVEAPIAGQSPDRDDALYRLADLAVSTGIPDLALNIDHYLYGHPKVSNAR
jgi:hypothetical protein